MLSSPVLLAFWDIFTDNSPEYFNTWERYRTGSVNFWLPGSRSITVLCILCGTRSSLFHGKIIKNNMETHQILWKSAILKFRPINARIFQVWFHEYVLDPWFCRTDSDSWVGSGPSGSVILHDEFCHVLKSWTITLMGWRYVMRIRWGYVYSVPLRHIIFDPPKVSESFWTLCWFKQILLWLACFCATLEPLGHQSCSSFIC